MRYDISFQIPLLVSSLVWNDRRLWHFDSVRLLTLIRQVYRLSLEHIGHLFVLVISIIFQCSFLYVAQIETHHYHPTFVIMIVPTTITITNITIVTIWLFILLMDCDNFVNKSWRLSWDFKADQMYDTYLNCIYYFVYTYALHIFDFDWAPLKQCFYVYEVFLNWWHHQTLKDGEHTSVRWKNLLHHYARNTGEIFLQ